MGRQPRIQFPGAIYHVFARGINRQPVFTQREDYELFLEALISAIELAQFEVWRYALMDNHYHLLAMTPNGDLVQAMHALQNRYVKSFNQANHRVGPLFQGRYKSLVVVDESYLMELSRYIHLNPYRKQMVKKPERYEWSSYRAYIGLEEPPAWLRAEALLDRFGSTREESFIRHKSFIEAGKDLPEWSPFDVAVEGIMLGSKKLLRRLLKGSDPEMITMSKGIQWSKLYTPDDIVKIIIMICSVSPDVVRSRQRPLSAPRAAAIYLSRRHTTWSLSSLGAYFGVSYSAISKTCRECESKLAESPGNELHDIITVAKTMMDHP